VTGYGSINSVLSRLATLLLEMVEVGGVNTSHACHQVGFMTQLTHGRKTPGSLTLHFPQLSCTYMCVSVHVYIYTACNTQICVYFDILSTFISSLSLCLSLSYSLWTV